MPADAAALTGLRAHMLRAMGADASAPDWAGPCEADLVRRLAQPDRFAGFLVEVDGRAVSGGVGWLEEHLPSPGRPDGRRGHIASMSTDPGYLRRGYARQVFGALMGWFGELGVPRVDLRSTEAGRPLYESFGFRVLGPHSMGWTDAGPPPGLGLRS
ncbi:MAG: hydrolase [Frankiales bacterium]|nr:hydrolase [Frankiales bacterium]